MAWMAGCVSMSTVISVLRVDMTMNTMSYGTYSLLNNRLSYTLAVACCYLKGMCTSIDIWSPWAAWSSWARGASLYINAPCADVQ